MHPDVPFEILEQIASIIFNDNFDISFARFTIKSLSLVSSAFTGPCQKHLFRHVILQESYTSSPGAQWHSRIQGLLEIFQTTPHLTSYVKVLEIPDLGCPMMQSWGESLAFTGVLELLQSSQILTVILKGRKMTHGHFEWPALSKAVRLAFYKILSLPSISTIAIADSSIPSTLFSKVGGNLKVVKLSKISWIDKFDIDVSHFPTADPGHGQARPTRLELETHYPSQGIGHGWDSRNIASGLRLDLSCVEFFSFRIRNFIPHFNPLFSILGPNLKELEVDIMHDPSRMPLLNLSAFHSLLKLTLRYKSVLLDNVAVVQWFQSTLTTLHLRNLYTHPPTVSSITLEFRASSVYNANSLTNLSLLSPTLRTLQRQSDSLQQILVIIGRQFKVSYANRARREMKEKADLVRENLRWGGCEAVLKVEGRVL